MFANMSWDMPMEMSPCCKKHHYVYVPLLQILIKSEILQQLNTFLKTQYKPC